MVRIKQELIAKKVTNWQSYFQTEELNILEMAELHELLGRGNKLDDDDYDDDHDDFEQEDPSRPGSEKSPASVGQREDNPHDVSSVQKAPSTPEVAEEITTEQEIIEEQVKENASEGSDIWVF
ncbi:hypothetical protein FOL47_003933 [Perkinsus chesapeaki]|uniref:Uncharacterized protein n=1 Tax=Perkinsus chesapeaki TaxID=330153 RepID=A0A7J6KL04_PERCH|nr:hypothetical protein FOL47_003933 [Perkinsus chesapeaki]